MLLSSSSSESSDSPPGFVPYENERNKDNGGGGGGNDDANDATRFVGRTVPDVLSRCYRELLLLRPLRTTTPAAADFDFEDDPLEAEESAVHLVSHVLDLDWDTGYRELRELIGPLVLPLREQEEEKGKPSRPQQPQRSPLSSRKLTEEESRHLSELLERRRKFEPLQYLVGRWDFLHLTGLRIRPPLLCPRPETEELVELVALDILQNYFEETPSEQPPKQQQQQPIRILDVGCGTGCIGIALADLLLREHRRRRRPQEGYPCSEDVVQVCAIDVDPVAIETSLENARNVLGPNYDGIYAARLVSADEYTGDDDGFDVVVSNPPYIPTSDMEALSPTVLEYESHRALCGDVRDGGSGDGMDVIRTIVDKLPTWCRGRYSSKDGGGDADSASTRTTKATPCCWMEVDPSQPDLIRQYLRKWSSGDKDDAGRSVETLAVEFVDKYKDLSGRDRFVHLKVR